MNSETAMADDTDDLLELVAAAGGARCTTVAMLIEALDTDSAAVVANEPEMTRGGPPIVLAKGYIVAPERDTDLTEQTFSNVHMPVFARTYGIDLLTPPGAFYRWTDDPDEPRRVNNRTQSPSLNHRSEPKRPEAGLSVSFGPWHYGAECRYCYFVEGNEIAKGSDGEPVIDLHTAHALEPLMSRRELFDKFAEANAARFADIESHERVAPVSLLALLLGCY